MGQADGSFFVPRYLAYQSSRNVMHRSARCFQTCSFYLTARSYKVDASTTERPSRQDPLEVGETSAVYRLSRPDIGSSVLDNLPCASPQKSASRDGAFFRLPEKSLHPRVSPLLWVQLNTEVKSSLFESGFSNDPTVFVSPCIEDPGRLRPR